MFLHLSYNQSFAYTVNLVKHRDTSVQFRGCLKTFQGKENFLFNIFLYTYPIPVVCSYAEDKVALKGETQCGVAL